MRIQDAQVTFNMLNPIKLPKGNEKFLKTEAVKKDINKAIVDGVLKDHYIDPGETPQNSQLRKILMTSFEEIRNPTNPSPNLTGAKSATDHNPNVKEKPSDSVKKKTGAVKGQISSKVREFQLAFKELKRIHQPDVVFIFKTCCSGFAHHEISEEEDLNRKLSLELDMVLNQEEAFWFQKSRS
ncbi:uncharacterized protein G2W53_000718 [Senna tora]|uniref:Uncharacterized protein n=1 Tax=Senna tora TaxID=362788 RepID=A0A834XFX6_9FABA|nr:uncharacterized protein G2W53_000718 [Senna tora]